MAPSATSPVDQAFLRFQKSGNPEDLAEVFDETVGRLLRVAKHLASDMDSAEDLVQATFLLAIEKSATYQHKAGVISWLLSILHNVARMRRRSEKSREDGQVEADLEQIVGEKSVEPSHTLLVKELSQAVADAIERLPVTYRPVLNLHLRFGLSPADIAMNLSRSPSTVRMQLKRGLEMLRRALPTSLIAGAVVLTSPVQGVHAMREVVLSKAAVVASARKAANASFLFGLGKKGGLVLAVGMGTLAAVALWVTAISGGGSGGVSTTTSNFANVLGNGNDVMDSAVEDSRDGSALLSPSPAAANSFPCPPDPRRIPQMNPRIFTSTSITSIQPPNLPIPMRTLSTLVLSTSILYPTILPSQSPLFTFKGQSSGEQLGYSVSPALDVNQDGYGDILAGSVGWSGFTGRAYLYSGQNGNTLFTFNGEIAVDVFSISVNPASDVDQDGYPDLLVGARLWDDPAKSNCGRLYLYSGKDGGLLRTQQGEFASDELGVSVNSASDVNMDGYPDYMAGAQGWDDVSLGGKSHGRVYLYSGKDHSLVSTYQPEKFSTQLGYPVSSASDVNLDGYPDLVAGAQEWDDPNGGFTHGRIYVFSGKDGNLLFTYQGEQDNNNFGASVCQASDLNLDGYPDIVSGAPNWDDLNVSTTSDHGRIYAISGQTGSLLFAINGEGQGDGLGIAVSGGQDVNQDAYPDILAGAWFWDNPADSPNAQHGRVYLISGQDQGMLWIQNGEKNGNNLGRSTSIVPDMNQDGFPELCTGADHWSNPAYAPDTDQGRVYVYSGISLPLTSDEHLLSTAQASTQNLFLSAGASHAGKKFWVFGNFAVNGATPGVTLGSVNIPLNPDPWTQVTIDFANTAALFQTKGTLDGSGQASASLNSLAPQPAAPLGLTLQHCYLVYESGPPDAYYLASNLVPWTTVP